MTLEELQYFLRIAREMRVVQKRFFGGERSPDVVRHARDLERRFDRGLERLAEAAAGDPALPSSQLRLFD
jgi:hypothetical protein